MARARACLQEMATCHIRIAVPLEATTRHNREAAWDNLGMLAALSYFHMAWLGQPTASWGR